MALGAADAPAGASSEPVTPSVDGPDLVHVADRWYWTLAAVVGIGMGSADIVYRPTIYDDIWEHSAVVRELARHPLHPHHPILLSNKPHAYFTLYSLGVAIFSRLSGVGSLAALKGGGLVNLVLFLAAFPLFVRSFSSRRRAPFYALVLALLCWGVNPPQFSAFYHLNAFGGVLPYPSTFATAVMFATVGVWDRYLRLHARSWLVLTALGAGAVVVTHPLVSFVLFAALLVRAVGERDVAVRSWLVPLVGIGAVAVAVALAWPYYPAFDLLVHGFAKYNSRNRIMYAGVWWWVWPALVAVPIVVSRLRVNWRDPLALLPVALLVPYLYGWVTGQWNEGRVISFVVLALQLVLADWIAGQEPVVRRWLRGGPVANTRTAAGGSEGDDVPRSRTRVLALVGAVGIVVVVALANMGPGVVGSVPRTLLPGRIRIHYHLTSHDFGTYAALFRGTPPYAVTMAQPEDGWGIPTYGGKVVSALKPQAFIDDEQARATAVQRFFDEGTSQLERRAILQRWQVTYILLHENHGALAQGTAPVALLMQLGVVQRSVGAFTLLRVTGT